MILVGTAHNTKSIYQPAVVRRPVRSAAWSVTIAFMTGAKLYQRGTAPDQRSRNTNAMQSRSWRGLMPYDMAYPSATCGRRQHTGAGIAPATAKRRTITLSSPHYFNTAAGWSTRLFRPSLALPARWTSQVDGRAEMKTPLQFVDSRYSR